MLNTEGPATDSGVGKERETMANTASALWFTLLLGGMLLVNGATDTPVAIAGAVGAGVLSPGRGVILAAAANLLGLWCAAVCFPGVGHTVAELAVFPDEETARRCICAGMTAAIVFAVLAWRYGLPSSESHALLAGVSGAAWIRGIPVAGHVWVRVGGGVLLCVLPALLLSRVIGRQLSARAGDRTRNRQFSRGLVATAAWEAWLHGAQDGQKFYALYLLSRAGQKTVKWEGLWWIGGLLAIGCLLGGGRILRTVSGELGYRDPANGVGSALGCNGALLLCTLLGLPASTTHAKVCALIGASGSGTSRPDPMTVRRLIRSFVWTVPACFAIGALISAFI